MDFFSFKDSIKKPITPASAPAKAPRPPPPASAALPRINRQRRERSSVFMEIVFIVKRGDRRTVS